MKQAQNNFLTVPTHVPTENVMHKSGIFPKKQFYTPKSFLNTSNNQSSNNSLNNNNLQKKNEPLTPNLQKKSFLTNNYLNTLKNPQQKFNYTGTSKSMIFSSGNNTFPANGNNIDPKKSFGLLQNMARTVKQPQDDQHLGISKNSSFVQNKGSNFLEVPQKGNTFGKSPFSKRHQYQPIKSNESPNNQNQKNPFPKRQFRPSMDPNQKQDDYNFKKPIISKFKNFSSISPNNINKQPQKINDLKPSIDNQKSAFTNSNNLNTPMINRQRSNTSNQTNLHRVHTQSDLTHPQHQSYSISSHTSTHSHHIEDHYNRRMSDMHSFNSYNSSQNDSIKGKNEIKRFQIPSKNFLMPEPMSAGKVKTFSANKQQNKVQSELSGGTVPNFLKFKLTPKKDQQKKIMQSNFSKQFFSKSNQKSQGQQTSNSNERFMIRPSQFGTKINQIIKKPQKKWSMDDFQIKQRLGKGAFGDVYIARQKQVGFICVLKKLSKKKIKQNNLQQHVMREIKIQSYLDHKNLTSLYGFFDDQDYIYLILEFLTDGSLSQTKKKKRLPEAQVSNIVKQVCQGLKFMHNEQIIHRDLKPQNIFVHEDYMKLGDFGCAVFTNTKRTTVVGCLAYISPQQLNNDSYDDKIDVWSVGVLTYQLIAGKAPFQADIVKIARQQKQAKLSLVFDETIQFSSQARSFISKLLQQIPQNRMTIKQALNHPFITKYKQSLDEMIMMETKSLRTP